MSQSVALELVSTTTSPLTPIPTQPSSTLSQLLDRLEFHQGITALLLKELRAQLELPSKT